MDPKIDGDNSVCLSVSLYRTQGHPGDSIEQDLIGGADVVLRVEDAVVGQDEIL